MVWRNGVDCCRPFTARRQQSSLCTTARAGMAHAPGNRQRQRQQQKRRWHHGGRRAATAASSCTTSSLADGCGGKRARAAAASAASRAPDDWFAGVAASRSRSNRCCAWWLDRSAPRKPERSHGLLAGRARPLAELDSRSASAMPHGAHWHALKSREAQPLAFASAAGTDRTPAPVRVRRHSKHAAPRLRHTQHAQPHTSRPTQLFLPAASTGRRKRRRRRFFVAARGVAIVSTMLARSFTRSVR